MARLLVFGAALAMAGCGQNSGRGEDGTGNAQMAGEEKPWWHGMNDGQKAKSQEKMSRLIEKSPTYPRPPADPDIHSTGIDNRIALVDRETGDYLLTMEGDRERQLVNFAFHTKDGKLVCAFKTQMGGGYGINGESYPIRVYNIVEANSQTNEVRAARKRMSLGRFAEFMTAFPDFARHPERQFVIIDAPRGPGERL